MSKKGYDEAFRYLWRHKVASLVLKDGSIVTGYMFDLVLPEDDLENDVGYISLEFEDGSVRDFSPDEVAGLAAKQPEG